MNEFAPLPVWLCGLASAVLLWGSLRLRRRQRLLHDLPTSKARGVFIGLVELQGTAESAAPLQAFLSQQACVHYHYEVEEHWSRTVVETTTDKNGRPQTRTRRESGWATVANGGESQDFYLKDDTGHVLVRPVGANLEPLTVFSETVSRGHPLYYGKGPSTAVAHSDHRRRFVEHAVPLHTPLYVVGQARERPDVVAPEIAADRSAPLFLISARTEKSVQTGYAAWSWVGWAFGLLAAAGAGALLFSQSPVFPLAATLAAAGIFLAAWMLGWTWMVFNSLIALRHRVRQGWSLIDVQLKRRHDLLPPLAAAVAALSSHERTAQAAVATLRAQAQATGPGVGGPDYDGVAATLRAVVEAYPELTARESFARLHRELVETEQRVALARTYYNDIATQLATRLERIPDRWVAAFARLQPAPLLAAANFERAPVAVRLVEAAS